MNIFAGNFSLLQKRETPDIDFDLMKTGEKSFFIMGAHESLTSAKEVIAFLRKEFGELATHDISIESEDDLEIISSEYEVGEYERVTFEGAHVDFGDILERFADSSEAICVRGSGDSKIYANKIIIVDFIY